MEKIKILVSTIPVWSQISGSNTFSTLLDGIDDTQIANIYFRAGLPDSKVASRYFRIIESSVIKSVIKRSLQTGGEVESCNGVAKETEQSLSEKKKICVLCKESESIVSVGKRVIVEVRAMEI